MTETTAPATAPRIHAFELAGLGKAPFRCVGVSTETYQAIPGDPACPIQPGACCDFCGQAITNVYRIESADGRQFKVGCDCVAKTGDSGLRKVVAEHVARANSAKRAAKAATVKRSLPDAIFRARRALRSQPHPQAWAAEQGRTLLDWAVWMTRKAGAAGRAKVLRACREVSA